MSSGIYRLRAISALHAGIGSGAGDIDLPIAREAATGLPFIPGSTIKGVLRDALHPEHPGTQAAWAAEWTQLFGPAFADDHVDRRPERQPVNHAGLLFFDDARLLAMPVRALKGTCAWITCPFVLARYAEALAAAGQTLDALQLPPLAEDRIAAGAELLADDCAVLEEIDLLRAPDQDAVLEYWSNHLVDQFLPARNAQSTVGVLPAFREMVRSRIAIVADDLFAYFAESATEVRARVALDENRVVKDSALWYEELLPAGSLLWGDWGAQRVRALELSPDAARAKIRSRHLQLGGKASVGHGRVDFLV